MVKDIPNRNGNIIEIAFLIERNYCVERKASMVLLTLEVRAAAGAIATFEFRCLEEAQTTRPSQRHTT